MKQKLKYIFIVIGVVLFVVGFSWLINCALIKAICACFDWEFSWKIATGIWLILLIISGVIRGAVKSNG